MDTGIRDELAQIRELLEQHLDLTKARLPIPQDSTALIAEKTQDFVGRRYVFAAIRDFLLQKPKGYFVLEGDPGVGKSAILAKFAQCYRGSCLTHFNNRGTDYKNFLKNICTQLIGGYGLDYTALPENTLEDETVLTSLLGEVSRKLLPGKKLVIVVDALDEVDISKQIAGKNVLYLPDFLPDNVYFIVSKRPEQLNLPPVQLRTLFNLMQYPAKSVEDARYYVETVTSKSSQIQNWVQAKNSTLENFWGELVAKSANNFMYLRYVLHDIQEGIYQGEGLDSLPQGLVEYYARHWQVMGMNGDPAVDLALEKKIITIYVLSIYILLEVQQPVSRRLLAKLTGVTEYHLRPILTRWGQFLRIQFIDGEDRYAIYHASFGDFLRDRAKDSGVDLEEINRRIAENLAGGAPR